MVEFASITALTDSNFYTHAATFLGPESMEQKPTAEFLDFDKKPDARLPIPMLSSRRVSIFI
jgi:hypothetical protein